MNRGEAYHKQMVETPVGRLIVKLGIPTTIAMLITNVYNLVDTYFVGTLGTSQQGATGILFTLKIEICKRMVKYSVNDPIILAFRKEIRSF